MGLNKKNHKISWKCQKKVTEVSCDFDNIDQEYYNKDMTDVTLNITDLAKNLTLIKYIRRSKHIFPAIFKYWWIIIDIW